MRLRIKGQISGLNQVFLPSQVGALADTFTIVLGGSNLWSLYFTVSCLSSKSECPMLLAPRAPTDASYPPHACRGHAPSAGIIQRGGDQNMIKLIQDVKYQSETHTVIWS